MPPLYNFTPPTSTVGHRHTSLGTTAVWNAFWYNFFFYWSKKFFLLVQEIWFNFQINVQCIEKAISKIFFHISWNLEQIWHLWHIWVISKGLRKMGLERPGGIFSSGHLTQLNSVGSGVDWVMGLSSCCEPVVMGMFTSWLHSIEQ